MIIDGNKLTEYDKHTQYFLKADLKWLSDCEYETTLTEVTFPSFTFPLGEQMRVRINKIENNIVELTSNISDKEFTVRYKLIR